MSAQISFSNDQFAPLRELSTGINISPATIVDGLFLSTGYLGFVLEINRREFDSSFDQLLDSLT